MRILLLLALSLPLTASCGQGYLRLYNYTDSELNLWIDGVNYGVVPVSQSPHWVRSPYGNHKLEVRKLGCWSTAYRYFEVSYHVPDPQVEITRYDL